MTGHMEALQTAWVRSLAAAAGCEVWRADVVDEGIDILLTHRHSSHTLPGETAYLQLQLKATTSKPSAAGLTVKIARQRMRQYAVVDPTVSTIVGALTMPKEQAHWVYSTPRSLSLYGACYWINLAGRTVDHGADNDKLSLKVPVVQVLDDVSLAQIMERIGQGGRP
jgi:hypothetical protein